MTPDEIERLLAAGERVGFVVPTTAPDFLGWVVLAKLEASSRALEVLDEDDDADIVEEEHRRSETPYVVLVIELRKDVHHSGNYESESDYRRRDEHWCRSLEEVETVLEGMGLRLKDARGTREIDAP